MCYSTEYFVTPAGRSPVEEFIGSLDAQAREKYVFTKRLLQKNGPRLGYPYCKYVRDNIYELRFKGKSGVVRVLYFFIYYRRIVLAHGFIKKTQKIQKKEIELALKRKKLFLEENK